MGKPLPLRIAGIAFSSRGEAVVYCRKILNDGPIGSEVCGADAEFVEHLWLNRSDKHAEHPGKRVVRFERRYRDGTENWTRCFWAVFEDGTAVDFSFQTALSNIVSAQHPNR